MTYAILIVLSGLLFVGWGPSVCMAQNNPEFAIDVTLDASSLPRDVRDLVIRIVQESLSTSHLADTLEKTRLQQLALLAIQQALATEGWFSAEVSLEPAQTSNRNWLLSIKPGVRTRVARVDLLAQDQHCPSRSTAEDDYPVCALTTKQNEWLLPVGEVFRDADWVEAKRTLLDKVTRQDFPAATLIESQATVDADAAQADLQVVLDRGPKILFGDLKVRGISRTPPGVVERYVRFKKGESYDRYSLEQLQQSLQATGFFTVARVEPDLTSVLNTNNLTEAVLSAENNQEAHQDTKLRQSKLPVPTDVLVDVIEPRRQRIGTSLGVDTDAGPHAELIYRQNGISNKPLRLEAGLRLDRLSHLAFVDVHALPTLDNYRDSVGILTEKASNQGIDVNRVSLGIVRAQARRSGPEESASVFDTRLSLRFAQQEITLGDANPYRIKPVIATYEWTRRAVDNPLEPHQGTLIQLQPSLGIDFQKFEATKNNRYSKLYLRAQLWLPLSTRDVLTLRTEAGQIWARDPDKLPTEFQFRTGGANSVRGYSYQSLGRQLGNVVLPENALLVGSVEYTHWINQRYGAALFADAGNAANTLSGLKPAIGVGAGVRIRTPAGPIGIDLAYGRDDKQLRLHFSLGVAF